MIFGVLTDLGNQHYHPFSQRFHHCSKVHRALSYLYLQASSSGVSVLYFLDIFCKWNHKISDFFHLASMFEIRQCSHSGDTSFLSTT